MRRGGLLGDPIWVRSCYFLPPFENILFKNRIFYICGIEIFVRTATLLLPSCLWSQFPDGFRQLPQQLPGNRYITLFTSTKKSYKEYRENPYICHFCYKVSRKYYVSFLCVIYGGKKISLAFIILYSLWKGARAIKLPHCSEPLFSVFFFGF